MNTRTGFPFAAMAYLVSLVALFSAGCGKNETPQTGPAAASKPNIIFILADDLGYGDLGCFGQKNFTTPRLDQMAAQGIRFTDFYAGSAVCAPSRSVLLTGLHQGNTPVRANLMDYTKSDGTPAKRGLSLKPEDITIGEVLQEAGYRTGITGKWGLGERDDSGHPNKQGFDYFYGYFNHIHAHNHFPDHLFRNSEHVDLPNVVADVGCSYCHLFGFEGGVSTEKNVYADDLIRDESLSFIERNKEQPFFLFVSLVSPHANNEANRVDWAHGMEVPDYGRYADEDWPDEAKGYAAMMDHIDSSVGSLLDKLKSLGIDGNTIVLFSGDNGPHAEAGYKPEEYHNSNGPLRGIKRDLYEGGIRVPTIAWGPGIVPQGRDSHHPAYFGDLMATFAELSGAALPPNRNSLSFAPTLRGNADQQKSPEFLYWEFYANGSAQAARMGKWKAHRKPIINGPIELYNLENDIGETNNVAANHPELVASFQKIMQDNHHPSPDWIPQLKGK